VRELVTLCAGQYTAPAGVYGLSILIVPTQELAAQTWLVPAAAFLTVILSVTVFVTSFTLGESPQCVMCARVDPV
jgi:hypothetical protein